MHARLAEARRELPRAIRIAVAAGLAWWIARLLGADRPVFAALVPLVAIRDEPYAALSLSLGRMLGVIVGVLLGIAVVALVGVSTSAVLILLVAGLLIGLALRTGPELNTQIAISALLLVVATSDADTYALERIWETALGSLTTLVVAAFVLPPDPLREAQRRLTESAQTVAADLADSQGTLERGDPSPRVLLAHADEHARTAARAVEDLPRAFNALRWSPLRRGSRGRLETVERRQRLALRLLIQVRRLARDLASFAHRDDLREEWETAAQRLPPIISTIGAASSKALTGEGASHDVATAGELIAAYRRDDSRPVAAILRRPLVLLHDELSGPPE
jgi:uncharacterized membrane protein YgaE (UPF0421/DUF939 family)